MSTESKRQWRKKHPLLAKIENAKSGIARKLKSKSYKYDADARVLQGNLALCDLDKNIVQKIEKRYPNRKDQYTVDASHIRRNVNPLMTHIQRAFWDARRKMRKLESKESLSEKQAKSLKHYTNKMRITEFDMRTLALIEMKYM